MQPIGAPETRTMSPTFSAIGGGFMLPPVCRAGPTAGTMSTPSAIPRTITTSRRVVFMAYGDTRWRPPLDLARHDRRPEPRPGVIRLSPLGPWLDRCRRRGCPAHECLARGRRAAPARNQPDRRERETHTCGAGA